MITTTTATELFDVELRVHVRPGLDHLVVIGADADGSNLVLEVEAAEDSAPYDAALHDAGFEPVGVDHARRA